MLDDWDIEAIKEHIILNPGCKIKNRGKDSNKPLFQLYSNNIMWKAHIVCRDDVFDKICKLKRKVKGE